MKKNTQNLFKYRWVIGFLLLMILVALEINGSSLGVWSKVLPNGTTEETGIIIGSNRELRSDEWALFTPMAMSQYHNDYKINNNLIRATDTDVYMVYGQPVKNWSIIFRPFQIGYLFMSPAKGLSLYWIGKIVFLFLVSLEFGMVICEKKKLFAFTYAFMITSAPVVQWWFSTNSFPDMLVYGQGILLCINGYTQTNSYGKKAVFALTASYLSSCYILVMYPASQIPFFYVFFFIGLWIIISNSKNSCFTWKVDVPLVLFAILLIIIPLTIIIIRSWDTIKLVMNSVYPGKRLNTGGLDLKRIFSYPANMFFPFVEGEVPANKCEMATFFSLFPLGILGCIFNKRRKDGLVTTLLIVMVFLSWYTFIGFSDALSKYTLLRYSFGNRSFVAVSFLNLILLIRHLAKEDYLQLGMGWKFGIAFILGFLVSYCSSVFLYTEYLVGKIFYLCVAILTIIFFLALTNKRILCIVLCIGSLIIGVTVNPVRTGTANLTDSKLSDIITSLADENEGNWLSVSDNFAAGNYLIAMGAPTINSTNTYVNYKLWDILDPERKYEEIYNRYSHIKAKLTLDENAYVELIQADLFEVTIPVSKLNELGVRFILSERDLTLFSTDKYTFETVFSDPLLTPFKVYSFSNVN